MKASNLWSFRQLQAHIPPPKPKTHHDFLIEEMVNKQVSCMNFNFLLEMDE